MPPFSMYYYLGKYLLPFTQENYYHSPGPTHTIKALKHCPRHPITLSLPSTELFTVYVMFFSLALALLLLQMPRIKMFNLKLRN